MRTRLLPENEARHAHGQQHILRAYRPCVRTVYNIYHARMPVRANTQNTAKDVHVTLFPLYVFYTKIRFNLLLLGSFTFVSIDINCCKAIDVHLKRGWP